MIDAGRYIGKFRLISLPRSGFFEENLTIHQILENELYLLFVNNLLNNHSIKNTMGRVLNKKTINFIKENSFLIPDTSEANLTHGDFNPANILVKKINRQWKISAILDWEFCFSGSYLMDIGQMLRYSHKLPSYYEEKFIEGICEISGSLPPNWKKQAKLMDLLCMLHLLYHNSPSERPLLNYDILSLIANNISH